MTNAQSKIALCEENYTYWNPELVETYKFFCLRMGLQARWKYGYEIMPVFYDLQYLTMIEA